MTNRLHHETSPYLLQHAHNPVDWFPWGEEALAKAKQENKLLMVSIGYAACHWCHVMERESFADNEIATLLNQDFVSIKVDREERPDLDTHFMDLVMAMTGQGGWPMNIFLTPELHPVYGGTYFPPQPYHGLPAFRQVLTTLATQWHQKPEAITHAARKLREEIQRVHSRAMTNTNPATNPVAAALTFWTARLDPVWGGIGQQPKFPQPLVLSFLLRQGDATVRRQVHHTLDRMAAGGVRDQLAGAFHRYAVDQRWQVPHFELMLYDNALLARLYLEASQQSGGERHAITAREILDDTLERFLLPTGGFASSWDADSEGGEGRYTTWTRDEVTAALGETMASAFVRDFLDEHEGLVDGRAVPRYQGQDPARRNAAITTLAPARQALLAARKQRPAPARDDKEITSWNALMVSALARAGAVLEEPRYIAAAQHCLKRLLERPTLCHSQRDQQAGTVVFLEDYACVIQALLDLCEATGDPALLQRAVILATEMTERFQGPPLAMIPRDQQGDIPSPPSWEDGVIPAGNSVAVGALRRLALLTGATHWETQAADILQSLESQLHAQPFQMVELLASLALAPLAARLLVVVGKPGDQEFEEMARLARRRGNPGLVTAVVAPGKGEWPPLRHDDARAAAHLCHQGVCHAPVHTARELTQLLP